MNKIVHARQYLLNTMSPLYREYDRLIQTPEVKAYLMLDRRLDDETRNTTGIVMTKTELSLSSNVLSFIAIEEVLERLGTLNDHLTG